MTGSLSNKYQPLINCLSGLTTKHQEVYLVLYEDWYETVLGDGKFHYPRKVFFDRKRAVIYKTTHDKRQVQTFHVRSGKVWLDDGKLKCEIRKETHDCFSDWEVFKLATERVCESDKFEVEDDLSFTDGNFVLPEAETFIPQEILNKGDNLIALASTNRREMLRYTLCQVFISEEFPPNPKSDRDKALLKMSETALLRKQSGAIDTFLFIFIGCCDNKTAEATIESYGFENFQIEVIELSDLDPDHPFDDGIPEGEIAHIIEMWLLKQHPGSIPFTPNEYDATEFWWSGLEWIGIEKQLSKISKEFPEEFQKQSNTWIKILHQALYQHDDTPDEIKFMHIPKASIFEAALCEWLHGFNGASRNSYNLFEKSSAIEALELSPQDLHNELDYQSDGDAQELYLDNGVEEEDERSEMTLGFLTEEVRPTLRKLLSDYFECDSGLYWALHSTIWPNYDEPMLDKMNNILSLRSPLEMGDIEDAWNFVHYGWCDAADL